MTDWKLGAVEARFADIVWENAPIRSGELAKLCSDTLDWRRTTTYTVLKKLCDRGLFQNENGTVTVRMTKEEYSAARGEQLIDESFHGSLPAFLAAFAGRRALTEKEIAEIRALIDACGPEA